MFINELIKRPTNDVTARPRRKCWQMKNLANGEVEILLYDEIGFFGTSADQFVRDVKNVTAQTIHLRINSHGGDIFDGFAIHNALVDHPARIVAHVDGLAASTASWIAMAADEVRMPKASYLMIHDPMARSFGIAEDMRKVADLLDKLKTTIATVYADRSTETLGYFLDAMSKETWFDAEEAKSIGLADVVEEEAANASNSFDLSIYRRVPEPLKNAAGGAARPASPGTKREFEGALREMGYSHREAEAIASRGFDSLRRDGAADAARDEQPGRQVLRDAAAYWATK